MADAYVAFLTAFPWGVPLAEEGAREGLSKFIKNSYLACFRGSKYAKAPLATASAIERLRTKPVRNLVFEHVVPTAILQRSSEALARSGDLSREFVLDWLRRYWVTAIVTVEENDRLLRDKMPPDWDGKDPFGRYRIAGLVVIPNPEAVAGLPPAPPFDWRGGLSE